MLLPTTLTLLLAPAAPSQEAPANADGLRSEAELREQGWELLDGVVAQAGDAVITLGGLEDFLVDRLGPDLSQERAREALPQALRTLETIELETQAGEDLGIPPEEVDRIIRSSLDARRREEGVRAYLDYLSAEGLDPRTALESQSRELYRILWTREQLGMQAAGGRRVHRDSYLRPGTLRSFYAENPALLGPPARVRFQRIAIGAREPDGLDTARQVAEDVIAQLAEGASFQDLLLDVSDEDPVQSLEDWQELPTLERANPELATFAARAPEGSIYPEPLPAYPLAGPDGRQPEQQAWFVYRLNDRVAQPPPPFESRETQEELRDKLQKTWQAGVLGRQRELLERTSYRWRHPRFGGAPGR